MQIINYLILLLILCSVTPQNSSPDEIRKSLFDKMKKTLEKRNSFDYNNNILSLEKIIDKKFISDEVELDSKKIDEIGERYSLEAKAIEQIKYAFLQTEPNAFKSFEFSLNEADLTKIVDHANFTEYIGCCLNQNNIISYVIFRLVVSTNIYPKQALDERYCCVKKMKIGDKVYTPDELYYF